MDTQKIFHTIIFIVPGLIFLSGIIQAILF